MKYAIYDKAADGYLTKMEFEVGYSEYTRFEYGYNEYITEARLLDTPKEAADAIVRIESCKFMEKGRFVVHQFDDTLADQYIISEAGNPTKVVDNITVDLNGNINVKYGTMASHWSTAFLEYAINRMNALQKAKSPKCTAWCNTFDIYKVITVMDEKSCTHYQFIKVTEKGLTEYAKEEVDPLNKRIEELEKANVMLDDSVNYHNECRVALAEIIRAIKYAICSKVSDRRDFYISYMTDRIKDDEIFNRPELKTAKNDIPKICKHLTTLSTDPLNKHISAAADNNFPCIAANAYELLKDVIDINRAKKLANDIIDICEATTNPFEVTLKKFSQLYEAVNDPSDDNDTIMYAFKGVLEIFSSLEDHVRGIIDESVTWKHKAMEAEKSLACQKALNNANVDVIEHMRTAGADWKRRAEEAIHDYTKCNEALGEWKRKYRAMQDERDKALERAEKFKGIANSVYGMSMPGRSCFCASTDKKILIDKKKYDELVKWIDAINTTYDTMFFMNKPAYLPIMIEHLKDLTK